MATEPRMPGEFPNQEINAAPVEHPAFRPLLKNREYNQLARLLKRDAAKSEGSPIPTSLILAARQLCQVCIDCQEQKTHFRQLQETAVVHENEMHQTLQTMLVLFEKVADGQPVGSIAPELDLETIEPVEVDDHPGFWQRVQDLLGLASAAAQEPGVTAVVPAEEVLEPEIDDAPPPITLTFPAISGAPESEEEEETLPMKEEDPMGGEDVGGEDVGGEEVSGEDTRGEDAGERQLSLAIYCLGPFQAYLDDKLIESWPSGKGKSIFKYLVVHREFPTAKEVLMELFWPDADPDAARNNLNVAIYGLRQALRNGDSNNITHVLFKDSAYMLNPELNVWVDVEEFQERYDLARGLEKEGNLEAAIQEYFAAETLYQLEFLAEDRYDNWIFSRRQQLQTTYLSLLERLSRYHFGRKDYPACITVCHKMLAIDLCREAAHRLLMRCYELQGQRYLALRQYHLCARCLREELDVSPAPDMIDLYEKIRQ